MRNLYTAVLFLFISISTAQLFGQENESIESLYALRRTQADAGQDYRATERSIAAIGIYPTALVTISILETGISFDFVTYKEISIDKQERIEQRLISSVPGTQSVEIEDQRVTVKFSSETTEENIQLFFKILGYTNYEVK